ncbi:hypothetical protein D9M70_625960 [compost metagenome]
MLHGGPQAKMRVAIYQARHQSGTRRVNHTHIAQFGSVNLLGDFSDTIAVDEHVSLEARATGAVKNLSVDNQGFHGSTP